MDEQLARADNETLLGDTTQDTVSDEFEVPNNFEWVNPNLEFPVDQTLGQGREYWLIQQICRNHFNILNTS